jgi:hypothetical protein
VGYHDAGYYKKEDDARIAQRDVQDIKNICVINGHVEIDIIYEKNMAHDDHLARNYPDKINKKRRIALEVILLDLNIFRGF